jgi:hypothetical protein
LLAPQALDLVKSDDAHAKKLTALLKSYKAKAGVDVQADVKRAEAEKAARPFRELSHTEQDRRLVSGVFNPPHRPHAQPVSMSKELETRFGPKRGS